MMSFKACSDSTESFVCCADWTRELTNASIGTRYSYRELPWMTHLTIHIPSLAFRAYMAVSQYPCSLMPGNNGRNFRQYLANVASILV